MYSSWNYLCTAISIYSQARQQIDGTDDPATQTTDAYLQQQGLGSADDSPNHYLTLSSQTAASHTVDADGSTQTAASGRGADRRGIVTFTMELTSVIANIAEEEAWAVVFPIWPEPSVIIWGG